MGREKNLTLVAYDSIKKMMLSHEIVPGQRLVFVDLARQLGVSRTPVNNALSILAKEGFLDFIPHQGYSVHQLTMEEVESIYEIREILETGTISKAIRRLNPEKLDALARKKAAYQRAVSDGARHRLFSLDIEYHAGIIDMMDNQYLAERYQDLCNHIVLRYPIEDFSPDRYNQVIEEHEALFQAVQMKDVEWAKELIRNHHANDRKNLSLMFFQNKA